MEEITYEEFYKWLAEAAGNRMGDPNGWRRDGEEYVESPIECVTEWFVERFPDGFRIVGERPESRDPC